jgi:hypothetical protein
MRLEHWTTMPVSLLVKISLCLCNSFNQLSINFNIMKKVTLLSVALSLQLLFACSETDVTPSVPKESDGESSVVSDKTSLSARLPSGVYPIILTSSGEYVSSYGGGVSLGTSFIHPTTVDATGATDGQPIPEWTYIGFQSPTATLESRKYEARFSIITSMASTPPDHDQVMAYFDNLVNWWQNMQTAMPTLSSGGGQVLEVKGQVVRDHNSPTNASIVTDTYVYSSSDTGGHTTTSILLANLVKSGYTFKLYGPNISSGNVNKVTAKNSSGQIVTVQSYALSYSLSGDIYHFVGTITVGGVTLQINDDVYSAM